MEAPDVADLLTLDAESASALVQEMRPEGTQIVCAIELLLLLTVLAKAPSEGNEYDLKYALCFDICDFSCTERATADEVHNLLFWLIHALGVLLGKPITRDTLAVDHAVVPLVAAAYRFAKTRSLHHLQKEQFIAWAGKTLGSRNNGTAITLDMVFATLMPKVTPSLSSPSSHSRPPSSGTDAVNLVLGR